MFKETVHEGWWLTGGFGALRPEGRRFESHPNRHLGTLGKSFAHNSSAILLHASATPRCASALVFWASCKKGDFKVNCIVLLYCINSAVVLLMIIVALPFSRLGSGRWGRYLWVHGLVLCQSAGSVGRDCSILKLANWFVLTMSNFG